MKVLCAICLLVGAIAITQSWVRSPTTTELFNLRSRCTELGDKILSEQKKSKAGSRHRWLLRTNISLRSTG